MLCTGYSTFMEVSLWVNNQWWSIVNMHSNVSLCSFNLTVPLQSTCLTPILYTKESITKALLFTTVHRSLFSLCDHIISSHFVIKQVVKLLARACKLNWHTASIILYCRIANFRGIKFSWILWSFLSMKFYMYGV